MLLRKKKEKIGKIYLHSLIKPMEIGFEISYWNSLTLSYLNLAFYFLYPGGLIRGALSLLACGMRSMR